MVKKSVWIIIAIVVVALALGYLLFMYQESCKSEACFNQNLAKCDQASYIREARDASWKYEVRGMEDKGCEIEVTLLQMKKGSNELAKLEGKEMDCYLPEGTVAKPEENLGRCHGLLKEEMQTIIINRLHSYIVDNLGQVEEGLKEPL